VAGGVSHRQSTLERRVSGDVAATFRRSVAYSAPGAIADLALLIGHTPGAKFRLGVVAWADLPSSAVTTPAESDYAVTLTDGSQRKLDTPAFTVALRPSVFVGPVLGVSFGH
jgi:hypothetical protein